MEKNIPIFTDEVKTLTKREYFAGLAMQGLCANYLRENITGWDVNTYAKESVELANALLKELNDQTENKYIDESTTKKENPLNRPSAHSLIDIFKELKFGRSAADQKYLAKCIAELEQGQD